MLSAGLEGIASNLQLPPPQNRDFYHDNAGVLELPGSLDKSLDNMNKSEMLRARMGDFIVDTIYKLSSIMSKECQREVTGEDIRRFF